MLLRAATLITEKTSRAWFPRDLLVQYDKKPIPKLSSVDLYLEYGCTTFFIKRITVTFSEGISQAVYRAVKYAQRAIARREQAEEMEIDRYGRMLHFIGSNVALSAC